ncbi:MAG: hypothetical protein JST02_04895 [Bacteroidetes bacterium]|nr:hypothetical protein [Bacteroidota bacterium]
MTDQQFTGNFCYATGSVGQLYALLKNPTFKKALSLRNRNYIKALKTGKESTGYNHPTKQ